MNKKPDNVPGEQEKIKVQDKSNDRLYFTITPRLVWAMSEDPYEYTLWGVVKDIAGEDGQCIISREDMALLAMMSTGMASKCRDNLISKGLLLGECVRDPGYPQKVWHLTIPDLWEANVRWAKRYLKLKDRIEFKRQQRAVRELRKPSPHDASKDASPCDGGISPHDGGISPGDGKKIVLENPLEKIWCVIFENLKSQMVIDTFDKYIRGARPISMDQDGVLIIEAKDDAAREWMEERLTSTMERLLVGILNHPSPEVKFVLNAEASA